VWIARWRASQKEYFLESFKILTGSVRALDEVGVKNPERHMVILEEQYKLNWRQSIFLIKKTPFLTEEISAIDSMREKMDLIWLHHPQKRMNNTLDDYLFSEEKQAFLDRYPFKVDPPTDNCPFFFNFLKPIHYLGKLPAITTHFTYPVFMFKSLFLIVFLMVVLTIVLPLVLFRRRGLSPGGSHFTGGYLLYFACLGVGFMLVEIPLIQRFILFSGNRSMRSPSSFQLCLSSPE